MLATITVGEFAYLPMTDIIASQKESASDDIRHAMCDSVVQSMDKDTRQQTQDRSPVDIGKECQSKTDATRCCVFELSM